MAIQNSNLLSSFVNEVVKIVEDETIVRSKLQSVSDVYSWIEEYGRTLDMKWYLRSSRPSGARSVTSYSVVQSEPSKVTMVLCSSTECLYAPETDRSLHLPLATPLRSQSCDKLHRPFYLTTHYLNPVIQDRATPRIPFLDPPFRQVIHDHPTLRKLPITLIPDVRLLQFP
ncbi:hypothetical protein AVEN_56121-1 [Araneus ventricosus]|uniref:Uncharacterized protein n=1 Tax=Araneus ventricosus TaxID=182803 RepID=A0A4Y1ZKY7_ARAVE|nr:hypothetical protein AVEN_54302-1 [Araneus ventricosus]GBL55857.1 hypothetical protein AVEN_56121-1 [Araneus ventricosus]